MIKSITRVIQEYGINPMLDTTRLQAIISQFPDQVDRAVEKAARRIEAQAKENASGRPGPEVDTGLLRNSITVTEVAPLTRDIGPTVSYGMFVELGTSHNAPYAFLLPAFMQHAGSVVVDIAHLLRK